VHRQGALATAVAATESAQRAHQEARREREVLEKHTAKTKAGVRQVAERRAADTQDELALAAHARKPRGEP
jgi:flagellar biosynthesis chaperone FliJ